jgi:hypothetical protein
MDDRSDSDIIGVLGGTPQYYITDLEKTDEF